MGIIFIIAIKTGTDVLFRF